MSMDIIENSLDGRGLRIGIVQSRFNEYAGEGLLSACLAELDRLGVVQEDITLMRVPGALEIPFALQQLAATEAGIMQVGLDFDIPIANAVLTTENDDQAKARLQQKGTDAAQVAVEMANLRKEFEYDMDEGE